MKRMLAVAAIAAMHGILAEEMPFWGKTEDGTQCDATMMVRTPDCQKSKTFDVFNSWDWSLTSVLFPVFNSCKCGLVIVVQ